MTRGGEAASTPHDSSTSFAKRPRLLPGGCYLGRSAETLLRLSAVGRAWKRPQWSWRDWSRPGAGRAESGGGASGARAPRGLRAGHVPHKPGANYTGAGARARGAGCGEGRSHHLTERCSATSRSTRCLALGSGSVCLPGALSPRECGRVDLCFIDEGRADRKPAVVVPKPGALVVWVTP